jgi:hypothetical protein
MCTENYRKTINIFCRQEEEKADTLVFYHSSNLSTNRPQHPVSSYFQKLLLSAFVYYYGLCTIARSGPGKNFGIVQKQNLTV